MIGLAATAATMRERALPRGRGTRAVASTDAPTTVTNAVTGRAVRMDVDGDVAPTASGRYQAPFVAKGAEGT